MTITIETSSLQEAQQLLQLLKDLNINEVKVHTSPIQPPPVITRGDKKLDPKALWGIWKDKPRTVEGIRAAGWKRDWSI